MKRDVCMKAMLALVGFVFLGLLSTACGESAAPPKPASRSPELIELEKGIKALEDDKDKYIKIPEKVQLVKEPYYENKIAYYEFNEEESRWGHMRFGGSGDSVIRKFAEKPDEVGTVVLRTDKCSDVRVGQYGTMAAYARDCEVLIIDPKIPAVIYKTSVQAVLKDDSKRVKPDQSYYVEKISSDVMKDFFAKLPEKNELSQKPADSPKKKS